LCETLPSVLDKPLVAVYGHSYGARLAHDTFAKHEDINLKLILAGRGVYGEDSMNLSTLMDLYILRDSDPEKFKTAFEIVSNYKGPASDKFNDVKPLLNPSHRQRERNKFYWGNQEVMEWYKELKSSVPQKDNDEIFESVRHTYDGYASIYVPEKLKQETLMIKGFWDFLMAGATNQGVVKNTVIFNGSGHYPHFEEPEKFIQLIKSDIQ